MSKAKSKATKKEKKQKRIRPVKPEQLPSSKKKMSPVGKLGVGILSIRERLNLSNRQKTIIAAILSVLIVGSFYYGVVFGFNFNWFEEESNQGSSLILQDPVFQRELQKLEQVGDQINPEEAVVRKIKFEDLPVYPSAWVERNFNSSEIRNTLLSGPEADFDNDGLSNKAEFLYGSDPKDSSTLCRPEFDPSVPACNLTDKEQVDNNISPLTGFELTESRELIIERQDENFASSINDSFETAAREGVDFPSLYQLSQLIDLSSEAEALDINIVEDTRESYVIYLQVRIESVKKVISEDELGTELAGLIQIYNLTQVDELEKEAQRYREVVNTLKNADVPSAYEESHRALVVAFEKIIELIEHRKNGVETNTLEDSQYQEISKELAVEVVWGYRVFAEKLSQQDLI